ncbi:class I SAM-dependent methyltransferase [Streptococcus suis]|nr:class I SAM-dependent methyltransferase [Streptococcus suis]
MQRNDALYSVFNEDERLVSQTGQVEFLTIFRELEKYVTDQSKILDIGARTGVYSFPLAKIAREVVTLEPATRNYQRLTEKIAASQLTNLETQQKSSLELEKFPSGYFDIVLLFGPLYHLSQVADREETLRQAKRLLAPGGKLFIAFINHDMIPMTETARNPHYLTSNR